MAALTIKKFTGFTLIEILVVITILGILAITGMAVFSGIQKNFRDTRRKSDLIEMRKAIEIYYSQSGRFPGWGSCGTSYYPPGYFAWYAWSSCADNNWDTRPDDIASILENNNLLQKMPVDPINNDTYNYLYEAWPDEPGATFYLCVNLEGGPQGIQAYGHNYCIKGGCTSCH